MKVIQKNALKIKQGNLTLYLTKLTVEDFMHENFYQVDALEANEDTDGYQRVLDVNRVKKLKNYIVEAFKESQAYIPNAIFLATHKNCPFDLITPSETDFGKLKIEIGDTALFNVVDGQHRIESLKLAADDNQDIKKYEIPVIIAVELNIYDQMGQFLVVNSTQKSVSKDIEQQIISKFTKNKTTEEISKLLKFIQNKINSGSEYTALNIARYLNEQEDSPWYKKIRFANEEKGDSSITQASFVEKIKKFFLTETNPLKHTDNPEVRNKIFKNYWIAISELLIDKNSEKNTLLLKTVGTEIFTRVFLTVFNLASRKGSDGQYTVESFKSIFIKGFEDLPNEYLKMATPEYWQSGGDAAKINNSSLGPGAYTALNMAIMKSDTLKDCDF